MASRTLVRALVLPYEAMRTLYAGGCEVRLYRNNITGADQVGKQIDLLGLDQTVAAREGTLLQQIRHPNLVPVLDVVEVVDPGVPPPMKMIEFIMPFYPRGSVFDAMHRGDRFSTGTACVMAQAALRGIGELHEVHRILHRDFKSPNVLLAEDGTVLKVGDLGIAVPMEEDGTAEAYPTAQLYTPPETFIARRVGRSGDLYSVGLLLLELVNGPFPLTYTRGDCERRLDRGWPALQSRDMRPGPWVPSRLRRVIRKATNVDPAARYQSAHRMSEDLAKVQMVDWREVVSEPDRRVWEGTSAVRRDRRYRVEAVARNGRWVLYGSQHVTQWRRFLGPQIVADLAGAEPFFDQVVSVAVSR